MKLKGDTFSYGTDANGISHFPSAKWGFLAGVLGAFGALCLTSAMMFSRGNALLVMPIVFGGAVSVTAIVSVIRLHGATINPALWIGMALTVIGVVITAKNTPHGHAPSAAKPPASNAESATDGTKPLNSNPPEKEGDETPEGQ